MSGCRGHFQSLLAGSALIAIVAFAAMLRLADLDRAGIGNTFYASTVRSMGESWSNFVYAAYDPAGTLSVDKPPVALWLQVLSTKIFGFEGWAIILPMALAGTIAVPVVYYAGRRSHGVAVGLLASLILAVFPESVATSRDSTMDALVMVLLAAGAWLLVVAVEDRRPWLLVAWTALLGIVFNVKFFEGFVILPAAVMYVTWRYRERWPDLLFPGVAAIAVGFIVSLSWISFVEVTPTDSRPLVMNDESNSAYGLAFRYNGLERVLPGEVTIFQPAGNAPASERLISVTNSFGVGNRGVFRLFEDTYGPLIGFSVLLALLGVLVAAWRRRDWLLDGPGLLWGGWLITGAVLFSASNRAAAHYTESYAPAIAILGAVGIVEAWRAPGRWRSLALPALLLGSFAFAWWAYDDFEPLRTDTFLVVMVGGAIAATLAAVAGLLKISGARMALGSVAVAGVVAIPLLTSMWITFDAPRGGQITRPNPLDYTRADEPPPIARQVPAEAMLAFAEQEAPGATFAFAISDINDAGEVVAYTGATVLPIWNEYQRVDILEASDLGERIADGELPFVLVERSRQQAGFLSGLMPTIEAGCDVTDVPRVTSRFHEVWDCRPDR